MSIPMKGIDVSHHQGVIDWPQVASAGIDFAMIRAAYCKNDGSLVMDSQFVNNMNGAARAGIKIGIFLYSYAATADAAKRAAQLLVAALEDYREVITFPVAFDMEVEGTPYGCYTKMQNTAIAGAFLDIIERSDYVPMIYTFKSFAESNINLDQLPYAFWLAHTGLLGAPLAQTSYKGDYTIWQYSWTGRIAGIKTDVDLDWGYFDYSEGEGIPDEDIADLPEEPDEELEVDETEPFGEYVVKTGDNLTKIAALYGAPLRCIIHYNVEVTNQDTGKTRKLDNPDLIYTGDVIKIPAAYLQN